MKFDLHLHTSRHSSDSVMDPFALIQRAREVGLHGVVITEHDWLWTEEELDELRARAEGLVVLTGIEVSAWEGHFLVYGVHDPFALPRGIRVAALCREVHRQGGAVVAAHPFRWGQVFDEILKQERPELDGMELLTCNMDADCRRRAAQVFQQHQLTGLGSSDAHQVETVGLYYTEFDGPIRTGHDLAEAIRSRKAVPCERNSDVPAG